MWRIKRNTILCVLLILSISSGLQAYSENSSLHLQTFNPDPCPEQLTYRIGYIAPQIEKSEQDLRDILKEVEQLWESALNRDILRYKVNGKVAIHFVHNENDEVSREQLKFSRRIERNRHRILGMRKEYNRISERYRKQKDLLLEKVSHLDSLHEREYEVRKQDLADQSTAGRRLSAPVQSLGDTISQLKNSVDQHRQEMKRQSKLIQSLINRTKQIIYKYNMKFEANAQFNRGIYNKGWPDDRIYIFQFTNVGELKTVLAHEIGHALGIGHQDNPNSIMHRILEDQNIYDLSLTEEDKRAIQALCDS